MMKLENVALMRGIRNKDHILYDSTYMKRSECKSIEIESTLVVARKGGGRYGK